MNSLWCSVDHAHATLAELARYFVVGDGGVDHGGSVTEYRAAVSHRRVSGPNRPNRRHVSE